MLLSTGGGSSLEFSSDDCIVSEATAALLDSDCEADGGGFRWVVLEVFELVPPGAACRDALILLAILVDAEAEGVEEPKRL